MPLPPAPQIDYTTWQPIPNERQAARQEIAEAAKDLLWQARDLVLALEALTDPEQITEEAIDRVDGYERDGKVSPVYGVVQSSLRRLGLDEALARWEEAEASLTNRCETAPCEATATMQRRSVGGIWLLACAEHAK